MRHSRPRRSVRVSSSSTVRSVTSVNHQLCLGKSQCIAVSLQGSDHHSPVRFHRSSTSLSRHRHVETTRRFNWIRRRCPKRCNTCPRPGLLRSRARTPSTDGSRSRQADLLQWFKKLQDRYHRPIDFKRYDLCVTNGSMEGLSKVFELLLNPEEPILVDSPCYSGSLDFVSVCRREKNAIVNVAVFAATWIWRGDRWY